MSGVVFKPGWFVPQLQADESESWGGCLKFQPFVFRHVDCAVSVQAGWGRRSSFMIDGKNRFYPFMGDALGADDLWNPSEDIGTSNGFQERQRRLRQLFPIDKATHFEVSDLWSDATNLWSDATNLIFLIHILSSTGCSIQTQSRVWRVFSTFTLRFVD